LTVENAIALMGYREERNRIAKASDDMAWHARHEGVKYLLLKTSLVPPAARA
jgi:hypothetical protein